MALASIPVPPDEKRDAKARELVKGWRLWPVKTLKHDEGAFKRGDQFFVINAGADLSAEGVRRGSGAEEPLLRAALAF
jgi:hypothetical protein